MTGTRFLVYVSMTFRRIHGYCDIGLVGAVAQISCMGYESTTDHCFVIFIIYLVIAAKDLSHREVVIATGLSWMPVILGNAILLRLTV